MVTKIQAFLPDYFPNAKGVEYLSQERCLTVLVGDMRRDGLETTVPLNEKVPDTYRSDAVVYYTVINSWASLVCDILGDKAARALIALITNQGLISTISDAQAIADAIRPDDSAWIVSTVPDLDIFGLWGSVLDYGSVEAVQLLQVLCYPKRMSCNFRDVVLEAESLDKFCAINNRHREWASAMKAADFVCSQHMHAIDSMFAAGVRLLMKGGMVAGSQLLRASIKPTVCRGVGQLSDYWLTEIRESALMLYHGNAHKELFISDTIRLLDGRYYMEPGYDTDGYFSSGHFGDGCSDGLSKRLKYMRHFDAYKGYSLFPFGIAKEKRVNESRILCVPKTYKAKRIIAQEQTDSAYWGQAVNAYIQEQLVQRHGQAYRRRYDPSLQERNRLLAVLGSANGSYATIDLSGASDSISNEFARMILPPDVYALIRSARSEWLRIGDKRLRNHILLTSGTGLTFDNESNIFLCIAGACERVYYRWTGKKARQTVTIGDDLVVDANIFELVCDVLAECGFVVNSDKSFGSTTAYRESCGIEAFGGYNFTLKYYPRSGINFADPTNAVIKLCDLQHRFFYEYPNTSTFFKSLVMDMCPRMTSSIPGTECDDLWGKEILNPVVYPPHLFEGKVVTTADGISEELLPHLARRSHVTAVSRVDAKAYKAALKELAPTEVEMANVELMRYADELRRLSLRKMEAEDGDFVLIDPDRNQPSVVANYGFTKTELELR